MPVYLGEYPNCATNRSEKFLRAINSFLNNDYEDKKLIIISDGCEKAKKLYETCYAKKRNIKFICVDKQPQFSGNVRQAGIRYAAEMGDKDDFICYLDADDKLNPYHFTNLMKYKGESDWVYFNDYLCKCGNTTQLREVALQLCRIGTSNIAHKNNSRYNWKKCDGYGHDWMFIQKLMAETNNYKKIRGCGYVVCHTTGGLDV